MLIFVWFCLRFLIPIIFSLIPLIGFLIIILIITRMLLRILGLKKIGTTFPPRATSGFLNCFSIFPWIGKKVDLALKGTFNGSKGWFTTKGYSDFESAMWALLITLIVLI